MSESFFRQERQVNAFETADLSNSDLDISSYSDTQNDNLWSNLSKETWQTLASVGGIIVLGAAALGAKRLLTQSSSLNKTSAEMSLAKPSPMHELHTKPPIIDAGDGSSFFFQEGAHLFRRSRLDKTTELSLGKEDFLIVDDRLPTIVVHKQGSLRTEYKKHPELADTWIASDPINEGLAAGIKRQKGNIVDFKTKQGDQWVADHGENSPAQGLYFMEGRPAGKDSDSRNVWMINPKERTAELRFLRRVDSIDHASNGDWQLTKTHLGTFDLETRLAEVTLSSRIGQSGIGMKAGMTRVVPNLDPLPPLNEILRAAEKARKF